MRLSTPLLCAIAMTTLSSCSCDGESDSPGGNGSGAAGTGGAGASSGTNTGGGGGTVAQCIAGLSEILLDPDGTNVMLDGSSNPSPVVFTATGVLDDGTTIDIPASSLDWTATREDDTPAGTVVDGVYNPYPDAGGIVTITATDNCVEATTTVSLFLSVVVGEPVDPTDWEGPVETTGNVPTIVYPSDQTRFPRNLYRTLFQWLSADYLEFRLTFSGPNSTVTIYTDGVHGLCANSADPAGCWEVDDQNWTFIAGSNAGELAEWTVDALDTSTIPPTIRRGVPIQIGFSKQDVEGAIFYWSTTSAGIRRGRISQQVPEDYVVGKPVGTEYPVGTVNCVACHVVSRDGKYIAAPTDAGAKSLFIYGVTNDAPPDALVTDIADTDGHGFGTFSPDDEHVAVAFGDQMWTVQRASGDYEGPIDTGGLLGTHPDWSPLGNELLFATGKGDAPGGSGLARIPYTNGTWGTAVEFLPPVGDRTNLFPQFSPTGEWIAFSQGKGGHGDVEARLFAMATDGTEPVELANANYITSNQTTDGDYQSSQPTWAPPGDYHWIAFNTKREYGVVLPEGTQQIWVAAVDPSKIDSLEDPSYPAFRVPFQGLEENNHRAYWTLDIGDGGQGGAGGGGGGGPGCSEIINAGEVCDPSFDCCEAYAYCKSVDGGATFTCVADVPE